VAGYRAHDKWVFGFPRRRWFHLIAQKLSGSVKQCFSTAETGSGTGHSSYRKKNLPVRSLTKVENHCSVRAVFHGVSYDKTGTIHLVSYHRHISGFMVNTECRN
jgi:hypothetical protein